MGLRMISKVSAELNRCEARLVLENPNIKPASLAVVKAAKPLEDY